MKNELKNYGFVAPVITPDHYVFGGAVSLPKVTIREDGDWSAFLPIYKPQYNEKYDTDGCTVWGTENVIETMVKQKTSSDCNYSERFIYILAKVRPPGADPHAIAECIRANGLIDDVFLPMTPSFDEFLQPDPMTSDLLVKGQQWPFELGHEWVWTTPQTRESRLLLITEALKYSPLAVSVTAWFEENGVYVDKGLPNCHWCEIYDVGDNGYLVFDSYDQSHKVLSFDHNIGFAKRYWLPSKLPPTNWFLDLIKRFLSLFPWIA